MNSELFLRRKRKLSSYYYAQSKTSTSDEEEEVRNCSASDRRRAQNRAAQRAFRERKETYVKELERRIKELESASMDTNKKPTAAETACWAENVELRAKLKRLEQENQRLKLLISKNSDLLPKQLPQQGMLTPPPLPPSGFEFMAQELFPSLEL